MQATNAHEDAKAPRAVKASSQVHATKRQPLEAARIPGALLDLRTVSAVAGLSQASIYRLVAKGELPLIRLGARCSRVRSDDLQAWLARQGAKAA